MPSCKVSCQPRDQTQVSCIVGKFLTIWAMGEAQEESQEIRTNTSIAKYM